MKCPKCGNTNIKEGQKFCMKCGQSLAGLARQTEEQSQPQNKGWFTDGVRAVANAVTGGALNREIQREENQAVRQQARQDNVSLQESQNAERAAIRGMQQAEQDADRRRNERNLDSIEGMDVIQGKAIWSIQPGQIARCVSEREFLEVEKLQGVIIQEGCRAIVYVDGEMIGMLSGGAYNFPKKTDEEKKAEREKIEKEVNKDNDKNNFRQLGVFGEIGRGLRAVHRFFFGRKNDEDVKKVQVRQQRIEQKLKAIQKPRILRVYLVSERMLTLTFGGIVNDEGGIDFTPMTIPTTIVDVEMGVSLQMQINNISDFAKNYLADKNSITLGQIQQMLIPCVENTLKQLMRNLDYQADGLPEPVVNNLKNRIQTAINDRVYGIECVKVLDITDKSSDFERFREVERELFNSEKELDFLQRTGEFRNRLVNETNHQEIQKASSEEELRYALANVNKDKLLHEDEMEEFVLLLESQKRLREAKTKEEEYEALQDLRKNRLVKDDDVAALEDALEHNKIDRDSVTDIMRLQAQQRVEEARMQSEYALSDARMQHEFMEDDVRTAHQQQSDMNAARHAQQMQGVQLDSQRQVDEYQDSRQQRNDDYDFAKQQRGDDYDFAKQQRQNDADWQQLQRAEALRQQQEETQYNRSRQDKLDEMEMAERYARISRDNMAMMQEGNLRAQNAQNAHEEQMHSMDAETERTRIQAEATMSQEQIAAAHMKDIAGLDAAAQSEMAKMMGSGKEKEAEMLREQQEHDRKMYEQMLQMQQQNQQAQMNTSNMNQQQMMQMMQMAMNGMQQMGQNQAAQQQAMNAQQQQYQQQRYEDLQGMKNEYRDNMMHQQDRMDATQQQSLNYTSRVAQTDSQSAAQASFGGFQQQPVAPQQPQPQQRYAQPAPQQPAPQQPAEEMTFCGECGCKVPASSGVCPKCGAPLD